MLKFSRFIVAVKQKESRWKAAQWLNPKEGQKFIVNFKNTKKILIVRNSLHLGAQKLPLQEALALWQTVRIYKTHECILLVFVNVQSEVAVE